MNTILSTLLAQNTNHPSIKEILKIKTNIREKLTFHAITSSEDTYLQAYGISYHDVQSFNYIGQMLHSKTTSILAKIKRHQLQLNQNSYSTLYEKILSREKDVIEVSAEIQAEVQEVLNNIDLPISLFKRNDRYWYSDNPKTIQAKQYLQKLHQQDKQWKNSIRQKSQQIILKRQKEEQQQRLAMQKEQQAQKKIINEHRKIKIQQLERKNKQRQSQIKSSQQYSKQLKPLYRTIEKKYHQQFEIPSLQEKKIKLQKIRQMKRSIDMAEIKQHQKKIDQIHSEHQSVKIIHQPIKVPYRSKFYSSNAKSLHLSSVQHQEKSLRELYQKKIEYGKNVKTKHPPKINEELVQQMEERLKQMRKKRVRVNKKKAQKDEQTKKENSDDQEQQEDQQQEQEPQQSVKEQQKVQSDEDEDDEDNSEQSKSKQQTQRVRGQDQDLTRQQRNKIGVSYLQYVRKLRKKEKNKQQQQSASKLVKETKYKDYLKQMVKTSKTVDYLNTQSLNKQLNDFKQSKHNNNKQIERKMRIMYQKAVFQEELLKVQKSSNDQKIKKKHQIDDAVVATIKARLALMNK